MNILTWIDKDNLKNDRLLDYKIVKLYDRDGEIYSYHIVEKYRVKNGKFKDEEYYLFRLKDGKSVMNYTEQDYYELSKHLDISTKYPIFMVCEYDDIPDNFGPIPADSECRLNPTWRGY